MCSGKTSCHVMSMCKQPFGRVCVARGLCQMTVCGSRKALSLGQFVSQSYSWLLNNAEVLGLPTPRTVKHLRITFDSSNTELSLRICRGLVPGPPVETKIHGWSNPLYKMTSTNSWSSAATDFLPWIENSIGVYWKNIPVCVPARFPTCVVQGSTV